MLELMLFRHAKARLGEPGQDDHERDLAPRGIAAAKAMGALLQEHAVVPDLVLCSTARRTLRTLELAAAAWTVSPGVHRLRSLYLAAPSRILEVLRRQDRAFRRLMVVGHNPGLATLAVQLLAERHGAAADALAEKFPTGAVALFAFDVEDWAEIGLGQGRLLRFTRPRDLD